MCACVCVCVRVCECVCVCARARALPVYNLHECVCFLKARAWLFVYFLLCFVLAVRFSQTGKHKYENVNKQNNLKKPCQLCASN